MKQRLPTSIFTYFSGTEKYLGISDSFDEDSVAKEIIVGQNDRTTCNTCGLAFLDVASQRTHFKTDFHRLNLKRVSLGKLVLSEEEAEIQLSQDDANSLSASSEENTGDEEGEELKVSYKGNVPLVGFLHDNDVGWTHPAVTLNAAKDQSELSTVLENPIIIVLLLRAGHFAGVVYERTKVLASKSFHRYVVRQKQGGSQSSNDNKNGKAKSAGAQIRRYNEQQLQQDILLLIRSWSSFISKSSRIFTSVSKTNQRVFFQDSVVLGSKDPRIRKVPFITRRPTIAHAVEVVQMLVSVVVEPYDQYTGRQLLLEKPKVTTQKSKAVVDTTTPILQEEEDLNDPPHIVPIFSACTSGNMELVSAFVRVSGDFIRQFQSHNNEGATLLHHAACHGQPAIVRFLLDNGFSPLVRDYHGRTPYTCAINSKHTRDEFRRFKGSYPDRWDYDLTGIPVGITDESELLKKQKDKEKRKRQANKKKLEKQKEQQELAAKLKEQEEKEADFLANSPKCFICSKPISTSDCFRRLDFLYCSPDCMTSHRRTLAAEAALKRVSNK